MRNRKSECNEQRLAVLLSGDEGSDEFQQAASHLESCEHCKDQLTQLAADRDTWNDVVESLREADAPTDSGEMALDFLAPPSHPEMLGRLGRYAIESVIGSGGMGIVLKGHDSELNRPVAIKVLAPHLAHNGAARQRFAREARAAAAVVHEHVVGIYDVEPNADLPFMVMQFVPGQSLQDRLDQRGPLGVKELLRIGVQAAAGLAVAHAQGLVHRDIKPSNILLENDLERALLTDFGLARAVDDATLTRSGAVAGTPHYMSPEQASGRPADHRSDLFSLGAVLYSMATGHPPFRADQAMAVLHRICNDQHRPACEANPEIPDELSDIIDRLLEKKPQRRFASAEQVQAALAETLASLQQPGQARRRSFYRRLMRTWSTRPAWNPASHATRLRYVIGTMAAAGIAVLALGVAGYFHTHQSDVKGLSGSNSGNAVLPPALAEVLASSANPRTEYVTELTTLERDLLRLEAVHQPSAGQFLQHADPTWHISLSALEHELSLAENFALVDPRSIIDPKPEGKKQ
jgi:serine/threonine protein kinase